MSENKALVVCNIFFLLLFFSLNILAKEKVEDGDDWFNDFKPPGLLAFSYGAFVGSSESDVSGGVEDSSPFNWSVRANLPTFQYSETALFISQYKDSTEQFDNSSQSWQVAWHSDGLQNFSYGISASDFKQKDAISTRDLELSLIWSPSLECQTEFSLLAGNLELSSSGLSSRFASELESRGAERFRRYGMGLSFGYAKQDWGLQAGGHYYSYRDNNLHSVSSDETLRLISEDQAGREALRKEMSTRLREYISSRSVSPATYNASTLLNRQSLLANHDISIIAYRRIADLTLTLGAIQYQTYVEEEIESQIYTEFEYQFIDAFALGMLFSKPTGDGDLYAELTMKYGF